MLTASQVYNVAVVHAYLKNQFLMISNQYITKATFYGINKLCDSSTKLYRPCSFVPMCTKAVFSVAIFYLTWGRVCILTYILRACTKGLFMLDSVWMWIEFAFTRCASNANWIHIDVHTAKFYNWIVTELLLACYTHCSPSNSFHSGFTKPTF